MSHKKDPSDRLRKAWKQYHKSDVNITEYLRVVYEILLEYSDEIQKLKDKESRNGNGSSDSEKCSG